MNEIKARINRSRRFAWGTLFAATAACLVVSAGCSANKPGDKRPVQTDAEVIEEYKMDENAPEGLSFTLREAEAPREEVLGERLVVGEAPPARETTQLPGRRRPPPEKKPKRPDFASRNGPIPGPATG